MKTDFFVYWNFAEDDQLMFLVMIKGCVSVGKICDAEIFRVTETTFINLRGPSSEDDKIAEVNKTNCTIFYYTKWRSFFEF